MPSDEVERHYVHFSAGPETFFNVLYRENGRLVQRVMHRELYASYLKYGGLPEDHTVYNHLTGIPEIGEVSGRPDDRGETT